MAWTSTKVTQYVVADRRVHVYDCTYSGTGYGGGQATTGATGATGPTQTDLGFASTTDPEFYVASISEKSDGATGAVYGRKVAYDYTNQKLIVGATAAVDISDVTYRITAVGRYQQ